MYTHTHTHTHTHVRAFVKKPKKERRRIVLVTVVITRQLLWLRSRSLNGSRTGIDRRVCQGYRGRDVVSRFERPPWVPEEQQRQQRRLGYICGCTRNGIGSSQLVVVGFVRMKLHGGGKFFFRRQILG